MLKKNKKEIAEFDKEYDKKHGIKRNESRFSVVLEKKIGDEDKKKDEIDFLLKPEIENVEEKQTKIVFVAAKENELNTSNTQAHEPNKKQKKKKKSDKREMDASSDDDNEEVIEKRLNVFYAMNGPLLEFYEKRGLLMSYEIKKGIDDFPDILHQIEKKLII